MLSGTAHALTVRFGVGARSLADGVDACSLPCQMSCCCHPYLPRVPLAFLSGIPGFLRMCLAYLPMVPLYPLGVFCVYISLFLTSVGVLYTWLTLTDGWGFYCFLLTVSHNSNWGFLKKKYYVQRVLQVTMGSVCSDLCLK